MTALPPELVAQLEAEAELNGNGPTTPPTAPSEPPSTWAPIGLAELLAGGELGDPPAYLHRDDGIGLLYRGKLHALSGEPEAGKGWLALHATAERLAADQHVLYIDFEDSAGTIVARLLALGAPPERIAAGLHYVRPDEPLDNRGRAALAEAIRHRPTLAIIDGVTEALAVHGLDLRDNGDVAKWLALLPRKLAGTGAAVVLIDHVVKDRENRGRYAIGAQHKLAGVDVAYTLDVVEAFGRGRDGRSKLTVTKDRPGYVRQHGAGKLIAELAMRSTGDGPVTIELHAPRGAGSEGEAAWRPTTLMDRAYRVIAGAQGIGKRAIRDSLGGKAAHVDTAVEFLIADGHVRVEKDGQAVRHYAIREYPEPADDANRVPVSQPCPDRVPDTGESDRVPVSPPLRDTDTGHGGPATELTADRVPDGGEA